MSFRFVLTCFFLSACALTAQTKSIADGVYSSAQAARGLKVYTAQCAWCHGTALEGGGGPTLAGDAFLANWSALTMTRFVDKIQKTMPFNHPGEVSRPDSIDIAAYILQMDKLPAGQADMTEASLAQIVFPTAKITPPALVTNVALQPPEGNLAELMRAIAFPNSNIIFNVQLKDPGVLVKPKPNADGFDYVEWGAIVYGGWQSIDHAAIALVETAPLFLTPGRKCQNGRMAPVERDDWKKYTQDVVDVAKLAHKAAQARDMPAFEDITAKLTDACGACHRAYRDRGGPTANGSLRCQPRPPAEKKQ